MEETISLPERLRNQSAYLFPKQADSLMVEAAAEIENQLARRKAVAEVLSNQGCECAEDVDMMHVGTDRCTACQVSHAMGWDEEAISHHLETT